ncbi:hypothetical protein [Rhodoferax sp. TS-BS-61-7]|uniref:hypothetical protein n=1 Tax=Rhodoferax sp. TS-BS-61-7 TaxID=2094194 RepID=UPI000CF6A8FB|nr:hypothetical protein [Rhodoferax sp. TS-BS-61-7]PQA75675.1 hypothetical protein C5F53_19900 [Rhodoferax sp. TS-BS-61-7]
MNLLKRYVMRDGNLTLIGAIALVSMGFGIAYVALEYLPSPLLKAIGMALGLALAAIGGFSGRAKALDLKPFTNDPLGWRKAKKSYQNDSEPHAEKTSDKTSL